ncbi:glutamate--cysteine ligase [Alphaproteobacteria bacterium]|nr:glutamate--cysteine ligase [Alphaproteobacteria bacterium]
MGSHRTIIKDVEQLVEWLANGAKPAADWRIGTEHEKFLFHRDSLRPVAYDGDSGVEAMLNALCKAIGDKATPIIEKGKIIGLKDGDGGSVSLEPGGQLELSGAPLSNLHQTCAETGRHLLHMRAVSSALGVGMLGIGFQPKWRRDDISWMPKGRYQIMRNHMPKVGTMGLDMMLRSCTVQVNLDYADEDDMRRKFRTSLALQPIATALFANSPFKDGKPSGWLSGRAHVWTDTDNARCGVPSCVFDRHFGYEQWIDYILDVPMYFLHRGEDYVDVAGKSFRDYLAGMLAGFEGEPPQMADFEDHITTAFPEVRLKQYLEMRGADSGSWANICALPAYWVGLLYCDEALAEAEDLVSDIGADDVMEARLSVAKDGLRGKLGSHDVAMLAKKTIDIASKGLRNRGIFDDGGDDESGFLQPLRKVIATQKTPAEVMLDLYHGDWAEDIDQVFTSNRY